MYRHVLVPVDCSPDTRMAAPRLAEFLAPLVPCQVTLVAVTSPAANEEQQRSKMIHARQALQEIGGIFFDAGVYTRQRVIEGVEDGDIAEALASTSRVSSAPYDLILLGSHATRQEEFDMPCAGSIADRICRKVNLPVLVLPTRGKQQQRTA